jgi:hypothetical protein
MRLTLRTLLAYLEDALPPESAKRIGRMIARSPDARHVVRRIRKVVRRRRLIAVKPDSESRRGMDANDMAEYLDNVLPEEEVGRVERRCLKHDALLAEAAACHQILSRVLGEPPTVNDEARRKAYAAVGVVASSPTNVAVVGTNTVPKPDAMQATPVAAGPEHAVELPIPTLAPPESPAGRLALFSLVAMLFVALGLVLWRGLEPAPTVLADANESRDEPRPAAANEEKSKAPPPAAVENGPQIKTDEPLAVVKDRDKNDALIIAAEPASKVISPHEEASAKSTDDASRKPPPPPIPAAAKPAATPPAIVKVAEYTSPIGVLCRLRDQGPERLQTGAAVMTGDVLVNLDGSRSRLSIGQHKLDFVDSSKLKIRPGSTPIFEPRRGRFVFLAIERPAVFHLGIGGDDLAVHLTTPNSVLTLEYLPATSAGGTETPPAVLVGAVAHDVVLEQRGRRLDLKRGSIVDVGAGRGIGTPHAGAPPAWLTASQLNPVDLKAADRLAERNTIPFGTQGVVDSLRARMVDRQRDVRRMALRALVALEAYGPVVDALGDGHFADNRANAFVFLRPIAQTDVDGTEAVRKALLHSLPLAEAEFIIRLLRGFSAQEFAHEAVGRQLLQGLDSETLIVRELAIRNLRELTGKDFGYSPTDPAVRRAIAVKQAEAFLRERR